MRLSMFSFTTDVIIKLSQKDITPLNGQNSKIKSVFGPYWGTVSDNLESACNVGDPGSIHGTGRSPGEGNGNPL